MFWVLLLPNVAVLSCLCFFTCTSVIIAAIWHIIPRENDGGIGAIFAQALLVALSLLFGENPIITLESELRPLYRTIFPVMFYGSAGLFALAHVGNFWDDSTVVPRHIQALIVAPHFFIGLLSGYIRMKYGLGDAILLHSVWNLCAFVKIRNVPMQFVLAAIVAFDYLLLRLREVPRWIAQVHPHRKSLAADAAGAAGATLVEAGKPSTGDAAGV